MSEQFSHRDLTGARFESVDLDRSTWQRVSFAGASMRSVDFSGTRIRSGDFRDVEIFGDVESLVVNGVDVAPYVESELDRRHPERLRLHPTDVAGYREAWTVIEDLWAATVTRARGLDEELLHRQVDEEWSFIETLRHLAFATDAWIRRGLLGDPAPWDPLDLPWDEMPDSPGVPRDRTARPSLDTALALRADRMATVRTALAEMTDERLAGTTTPVEGPGWPPAHAFPVREVFDVVINEEWWHRRFAERDLDALTGASSPR